MNGLVIWARGGLSRTENSFIPSTGERVVWKKLKSVCVFVTGQRSRSKVKKTSKTWKTNACIYLNDIAHKTWPKVIKGGESDSEISSYSIDWREGHMKKNCLFVCLFVWESKVKRTSSEMNIQHFSRTNMSRLIFDQSDTFHTTTPLDQIFSRCCDIWIDQCVLGTGEVWCFSSKTGVSRQTNAFPMVGDEQHCMFFFSALVYIMYVIKDRMYYSTKKDFYLIKHSSVNCCFLWWNCVKKYQKHESLICKLRIQEIKFLYLYHVWTFGYQENIWW